MVNLDEIEAGLGLTFRDKTLLVRALTHRSYINENPHYPLEDNERLEFLGDAVLDYVAAEYLYHHYPEMHEGQLTSLRAALVRTQTLAQFARDIGLERYIRLGRGEEDNGGRSRTAILCDCYEALIGAISLDEDMEAARNYFVRVIDPLLQEILATEADRDAKSKFQELAQKHRQMTPVYRTVREVGPDHAREFTVAAMVGQETYGQGTGHSKQVAAQAAAQEGLTRLENEVMAELDELMDE
jgi:ribonuclease III